MLDTDAPSPHPHMLSTHPHPHTHSHSHSQAHPHGSVGQFPTSRHGPSGPMGDATLNSNVAALQAMEELYALERSEALRRAEFEMRREEAIRRAEENLSMGINPPRNQRTIGHTHGSHPGPEHNVSNPQTHHGHHHHFQPHPYALAHATAPHHAHRRAFEIEQDRDDTPSPASTDSDSLPMPPNSGFASPGSTGVLVQHPHPQRNPAPADVFTPSTSPFLGGLRQLGIHSSAPSRAPSPVLLPPPHLGSASGSSTSSRQPSPTMHPATVPRHGTLSHSHAIHVHSHSSSAFPYQYGGAYGHGQKRRSTGETIMMSPTLSPTRPTFSGYPYSNDRTLPPPPGAGIGTPALSSGPSSTGSSPAHTGYSLLLHNSNTTGPSQAMGPPSSVPLGRSTSHSNSSSRAPSPTLPQGQSHSHLASSLRRAFGMTPIRSTDSQSTVRGSIGGRSNSHSEIRTLAPLSTSAPSQGPGFPVSMPTSRATSPPITLAPLLLPTSSEHEGDSHLLKSEPVSPSKGLLLGGPGGMAGKEKVVLPHFSEIEAAVASDHPYGVGLSRGLGLMDVEI